jgi:hypothetical protein
MPSGRFLPLCSCPPTYALSVIEAVPEPTAVSALPLRRKLLTWLLLACTSVWLAEVSATSTRFPFVTLSGWVMLVPLYGLHALLDGWLVMRAPRVTWPVVYLPGVLFGLYEAYITKVLWDPTWSKADWHWQAGGLYLTQTAILVLFWHPVFAFILPLTLVERAATGSSELLDVLPRPLRWLAGNRWGLVVLGLLAGTYSAIGASWLVALGSAATSVAVVLLVRELVGRLGAAPSLRTVLPSNREAAWLAGLLALDYLVLGFGMRRESLPPVWPGQVTVWVIYAIVIGLYVLALRRTRTVGPATVDAYQRATRRPLVTLAIAFTIAAMVSSLAGAITPRVGVAILIVGTLTCAVWFVGVVVRILTRPVS